MRGGAYCFHNPVHIRGDFGKYARIGRTCAGLDAPWDYADLCVRSSEQQRPTRVATALTLTALRHAGTDLAGMQVGLMQPATLLVAEDFQLNFLQMLLHHAAGLQNLHNQGTSWSAESCNEPHSTPSRQGWRWCVPAFVDRDPAGVWAARCPWVAKVYSAATALCRLCTCPAAHSRDAHGSKSRRPTGWHSLRLYCSHTEDSAAQELLHVRSAPPSWPRRDSAERRRRNGVHLWLGVATTAAENISIHVAT